MKWDFSIIIFDIDFRIALDEQFDDVLKAYRSNMKNAYLVRI